ncbi:hypothetical protein [Persicobacter psychrovividus]
MNEQPSDTMGVKMQEVGGFAAFYTPDRSTGTTTSRVGGLVLLGCYE